MAGPKLCSGAHFLIRKRLWEEFLNFLLLFANILVVTLLGQSNSAARRYLIKPARGQLMEKVFMAQMVTQRFCLHRKGCTGLELTKKTTEQ